MYFIVVKFPVKPDATEQWAALVDRFTTATRAEPGNLWFEWSRSVDDPDEWVLVEAFADDGAGAHVGSDHFAAFVAEAPRHLVRTPRIVSRQVEGDSWDVMGELTVEGDA
ncbi:putative quinol monooxygenase [Microlunatus ginsengisoli]|uniref:Quinol monooxygenase n=1 Tax=Microlunatus ginsengisoli TaxID=363863 RepID=A0ABP6ZEN5_9ACTN